MPNTLRDQAIRLISENLGEVTAKSYVEFYKDKSDDVVRESVLELLTEVIGEKKAREKVQILK